MANILNSSAVGVSIFHDFHPDSAETPEADYNVTVPDVRADSGGMHEQISDNVDKLRNAALSKKYKKHYQWKTTNTSFIELHKDLKSLGIENNKFFLVLYDKNLEDVDPYNTGLCFKWYNDIVRVYIFKILIV